MPKTVLYRCSVPDFLGCGCVKVIRAMDEAGAEYDLRRVPLSKKKRPEIEELTGQRRVPVLVDGDEVVHDSRRILEYVEHRWGNR